MIKITYITKNGEIISNKIKNILNKYYYNCEICHIKDLEINNNEKGFIFIMASGIVLRKYIDKIKIKDKTKDPFVILIDELGKNIVPLLSNHIGGGNYFSQLISKELNNNLVYTTASDLNNKIGIDQLSSIYFLEIPNKKDILKINKKILVEKVNLTLPNNWKVLKNVNNTYNVSYHNNDFVVVNNDIILKPKIITLGIGAKKNIRTYFVYWTIKKALYLRNIPLWRINCFSTIDLKKNEKGIVNCANIFNKNLLIFNSNNVNKLYAIRNNLEKSNFVYNNIGTYGVAEPCAILAVNKLYNNKYNNKENILNKIQLLLPKIKSGNGVSVSIAIY